MVKRPSHEKPARNSKSETAKATPDTAVVEPEKGNPPCHCNNGNEETSNPKRSWLDVVAIGISVVALIIAAIAAADARRQADISQDTEQRQLRAYVSGNAQFVYSFDETHPARAKVLIENHGITPAYHVAHTLEIQILPIDLPKPHKLVVKQSAAFTTFPGNPLVGYATNAKPFTKSEIEGVKNGKLGVFIVGSIKYEDIFGRQWETDFNYACHPTTENLVKLIANSPDSFAVDFEVAPYGNSAY